MSIPSNFSPFSPIKTLGEETKKPVLTRREKKANALVLDNLKRQNRLLMKALTSLISTINVLEKMSTTLKNLSAINRVSAEAFKDRE